MQQYDSLDFILRAFLLPIYDRRHLICDANSSVGVYSIKLLHVALDTIYTHLFCIHRDYLFLHVLSDGILIFFDDLWFRFPGSVS